MNTRDKMRRGNSKVRKLLAEAGFQDIHMFPHTRFSKDLHFLSLSFDGFASLGTKICLFQIKSNCKPSRAIQEQMAKASESSGAYLLWFDVVDREGVKVYNG